MKQRKLQINNESKKLEELEKKLASNPRFKEEYFNLAFDIGQMVLEARILRGISQEELAKLIGSKQPAIARIESGGTMPSLNSLQKIAKALDTSLIPPKFELLEDIDNVLNKKDTAKSNLIVGRFMEYNSFQEEMVDTSS